MESPRKSFTKNKRNFSFLHSTSKLAFNVSDILKLAKNKSSKGLPQGWRIGSQEDEDPLFPKSRIKHQRRSDAMTSYKDSVTSYKHRKFASLRKIVSLPSSCIASPTSGRKKSSKNSVSLQEVFSSESFYCTPTLNR